MVMELNIVDRQGQNTGTINLSATVFEKEYRADIIHQVVGAYLAAGRSGTKGQKNRSDVSGGGAKPWRQKGTGRARAGSSRSPIWRGGGVTFAARNRDYAQKVNKKVYRFAMQSILSELLRQGRLVVTEQLSVSTPKTQDLKRQLSCYSGSALILISNDDMNLFLASRNLPHVEVRKVSEVDPVSLISFDQVIINQDALVALEARFS